MKKRWLTGMVIALNICMCTACGESDEYVAQGMQYVEAAQYANAVSSFEKAIASTLLVSKIRYWYSKK